MHDEADEADDGIEGPEMPPDMGDEDAPDDEDGRFFGSGMGQGTARAIAFLDQVDGEEEIVSVSLFFLLWKYNSCRHLASSCWNTVNVTDMTDLI